MCATLPPARLADKAVAIPSGEVQFVATEFGSVNLIGKNLHERATAIIGLAHPDFREELWQHAKSEGILAHEHAFTKALSGIYPSHLEEIKEIDGTQVFFRPADLPTNALCRSISTVWIRKI
ncbi:MAG: hypothetical protein C4582_05130 [Desulfobacteraceae bacterium]|jgi:acyl-CoA hydrolase|nr:MAG: hypothetical protein C4582_05130 [Desulfobacteraceae bacterium]